MEINCKHEDVTPLSSFLKDLIVVSLATLDGTWENLLVLTIVHFQAVDLIAKVGESENYQITSEGYKFLLKVGWKLFELQLFSCECMP